MQLTCPVCKTVTNKPCTIEIFLDQRGIYGIEICLNCKNKIIEQLSSILPYFRPKLTPVVEGVKVVTQEQLHQILEGNLDPIDLPNQLSDRCSCGCTIEEFHNTGMLGCPKCYDHFSKEIDEFVTTYHGDSKHIGKKQPGFLPKTEKLKILKLLLAKAKEVENYERAKEIFEEIQSLENLT